MSTVQNKHIVGFAYQAWGSFFVLFNHWSMEADVCWQATLALLLVWQPTW